jgi:hypothetical protein
MCVHDQSGLSGAGESNARQYAWGILRAHARSGAVVLTANERLDVRVRERELEEDLLV